MKWILLIIGLILLVGTVSAADYYVDANTGDDSDDGLSLVDAWLTLGYADGQLSAGDTLYLVDGTWTEESLILSNSGTVNNRITITSYNGSPTLDGNHVFNLIGFKINAQNYTSVSNITFINFTNGSSRPYQITTGHDNLIKNVTVNSSAQFTISQGYSWNNSITHSVFNSGVWNMVQVTGENSGTGTGRNTTNITISNNKFNSWFYYHAAGIDLFGNLKDVLIENNTFIIANNTGVYGHSSPDRRYNTTIRNNTFSDGTMISLYLGEEENLIIENNTFNNLTVQYPIFLWYNDKNVIVRNNSFYNTTISVNNMINSDTILFDSNYIDSTSTKYSVQVNASNVIFRNPLGLKVIWLINSNHSVQVEYLDNTVFSYSNVGAVTASGINYYTDISNITLNSSSSTVTIIPSNITLIPDSGYGKNVTINLDNVDDVSNITANVSAATTVTMTYLVDNASQTYQLNVNDIYNTTSISNSDSIVEFEYIFPSAISTDFEVLWNSSEGWNEIPNTHYLSKNCTTYINGTTICVDVVSGDIPIKTFNINITGSEVLTQNTIAEDNVNRANNDDVGNKWHEQVAAYYDVYNKTIRAKLSSISIAVINQNVSLSQSDYNLSFKYIDFNTSDQDGRLYVSVYMKSATTLSTGGYQMRLFENIDDIQYYYTNGTFISQNVTAGVTLVNGTEFIFKIRTIAGSTTIETYQNGSRIDTKTGLVGHNNGTIGFSFGLSPEGHGVANISIINETVAEDEGTATIKITTYEPNNNTNVVFDFNTTHTKFVNLTYNETSTGRTYNISYSNGTDIQSLTSTSTNESLNFSMPLVNDSYNITESLATSTSTIIIPANKLGMFNNWTVATNFTNIAANESNDVCYSYYNVTTGEWESYYPPYSWNADYEVPLEASVFMFVDAKTTVTSEIKTIATVDLFTGWNQIFIIGTDNETVADIKGDIGANCSDVWWFNSSSGAYSNTSTDTVQPCQGILPYITQNFTWTRSDL